MWGGFAPPSAHPSHGACRKKGMRKTAGTAQACARAFSRRTDGPQQEPFPAKIMLE
jgi:hypothetical protein